MNTQYNELVTGYVSHSQRLFAFDDGQCERFSKSLSSDLGRANISSTGLKFGKTSKDGLIHITSKGKTADKVNETYAFTLAASIDALLEAEKRGQMLVTGVKLPRHLQFLAKQETPANVQTGKTEAAEA